MSHDVRVICRPEVAAGFRLASLPLHPAADAEAAERILAALRDEGRAGLVLLEDTLQAVPAPIRRGLPLVVPFPGPSRSDRAADERVIELLRRAIGYRVRLR